MDGLQIFERLGIALAIGLLVGLERGWREREASAGSRTAGIRTFALTGLLGGVSGLLAQSVGGIALAAIFLVFGGALAYFKWRESEHEHDFGMTTVVAGFVTFALGSYAVLGDIPVAAAAAVVVTILLASKSALHEALKRLTWPELRAGLILAAMTFLLLPVLPDRPLDPFGAINPHALWLMTILIAVVSFAGYAAIRLMGPRRGPVIAAAASGLVSSTAVTLNFSRLAADHPESTRVLAGSIAVSGAVMMLRALLLAGIVSPGLLAYLGPALAAAAGASAAVGLLLIGTPPTNETDETLLSVENPFKLPVVLRFGLLLAATFLLAQWAKTMLGVRGLMVLAAFSGLADVDAITLSVARMSPAELSASQAAAPILVAVGVNTAVKCVLARIAGSATVAGYLVLAALAAGLAGFIASVAAARLAG